MGEDSKPCKLSLEDLYKHVYSRLGIPNDNFCEQISISISVVGN